MNNFIIQFNKTKTTTTTTTKIQNPDQHRNIEERWRKLRKKQKVKILNLRSNK